MSHINSTQWRTHLIICSLFLNTSDVKVSFNNDKKSEEESSMEIYFQQKELDFNVWYCAINN